MASALLACFVDASPGSDGPDTDQPTSSTTTGSSTMPISSSSNSGDATSTTSSETNPPDMTTGSDTGASDTTGLELGRFGNAVSWAGGCGEEAMPSEALVFGGAPFTVELWLQIIAATADEVQMLVYRGGHSEGTPAGWSLQLSKAAPTQYRVQLCGGDPPQTNYTCVTAPHLLDVGASYHIAAVRTPPGSDCLGGMAGCGRLYVAPAGSQHTQAEGELGFDWVSAAELRLAAAAQDCAVLPAFVVMDELRIWSVARTMDQIYELHDKVVECGAPGLAAYYAFDSADGSAFVECSGTTILAAPKYAVGDSPFDE